jgi:glycosyltransferase involved in cell wall biosynthesis
MDSSSDETPEIARRVGAKVYRIPKKGLGYAYIESLKYIKGDYIIMGDADGTYDFMEMGRFIDKLNEGYDFVMGTRLKGNIHKGAMPWSHRYIGTPMLTRIINIFFKTNISDSNSGLRALTRSALERMKLESHSWEYASEMVIKSALCNMRMTEIPITLLPDKQGRKSHLRPFDAGWRNLRYIFLLASEFLFLKIGFFVWLSGFLLLHLLVRRPINIGNLQLGTHFLLLSIILTTVGFSIMQMGVLTQTFSFLRDFKKPGISSFLKRHLTFRSGMTIGMVTLGIGGVIDIYVFLKWLREVFQQRGNFFVFDKISPVIYSIFFIVSGVQILYFTLIFALFNKSNERL